MASALDKTGHTIAKVLRLKLNKHDEIAEELTRGESVFSIPSGDTYIEYEPTSAEWIREVVPNGRQLVAYGRSLFPFTYWIGRYNLQWLAGDLVAGITIGAVVVPQSMAYAQLANLRVEFGLYSSFMGVLIYWFFATSKDITIGPVAVMSTLVGTIVTKAKASNPEIPANVIASALAVIAGSIILFIGLVRCGWIVELISLTAISAFMTGSALNIAVGQVPALMGLTGFSSRDSTYLVVINILTHLNTTTLDAAIGFTALFLLYSIRTICNQTAKRAPSFTKAIFFVSTLRTAFVILLYTLISWLANKDVAGNGASTKAKFKILGTVPTGFQNAAVPTVTTNIISIFASDLPATVIVLLIEHIAISKSFGRINNYVINPSQELVAIGVTNVLGPFLGAYPATGSFSRTAIKSKAGVRTPFAGVITALVVLLAIYALPVVFYWIPSAALAAVIIHAVGDLITPPSVVYQFWRVSPLDVPIFFIGVIVTVFTSIENGIYCTIGISAAILAFRIMKARGWFLGRIRVRSVVGDNAAGSSDGYDQGGRDVYIPISHKDGSNPEVEAKSPHDGIFIYRFSEGFNYPNANHYLDQLTNHIFATTRRTNLNTYARPGDRPWNDPGPRRGQVEESIAHRPTLKAIILDFSSVNNVDVTSVQQLIDVRNQLDKYAAPGVVDWHIASINNRWTKRALVSAGFGYPSKDYEGGQRWKPIFSVADIGGFDSAANAAAFSNEKELRHQSAKETNNGVDTIRTGDSGSSFNDDLGKGGKVSTKPTRTAVVTGLNRPLFHVDVTSAVQSAIANVEAREALETKGGADLSQLP